MFEYPRAVVRQDENGGLVLDDPDAVQFFQAVEKYNCLNTLRFNAERVTHFEKRIAERGKSRADFLIVLLNVNDSMGEALTDVLMPGHDWDAIRATGAIPFARGLASRPAIQDILEELDKVEADKLRSIHEEAAVLVMDHGVAVIFRASEALEKP